MNTLVSKGVLPTASYPEIELSEPKQADHGDFACTFAMAAAKAAGRPPRAIAEALASELASDPDIAKIDVAGPGFLNLTLTPAFVASFLPGVLASEPLAAKDASHFAHAPSATPHRINVEFVSVNPNGPITIGSGRGAAYGSTLCNVLEAAGHTVHREYYINDGVNSEQMRLFAESVKALAGGHPVPERGYRGDYVSEVAEQIVVEFSNPGNDLIGKFEASIEKRQALMKDLEDESDSLLSFFARSFFDLQRASFELLFKKSSRVTVTPRYRELNDLMQAGTLPSNLLGFFQEYLVELQTSLQKQEVSSDATSVLKAWGASAVSALNEVHARNEASRIIMDTVRDQAQDFRDVNPQVGLIQAATSDPQERLDLMARALPTVLYQIASQEKMVEQQNSALRAFGVAFDTWFHEQDLLDGGSVIRSLMTLSLRGYADDEPMRRKLLLRKHGVIDDVTEESQDLLQQSEETADLDETSGRLPTLWLRSTKFGDDMDRVLRRRDGRLTYIASDVSYHKDKFKRPYQADRLITVLGPDHHGYIGRLTAVVAAMLAPQVKSEDPNSPELTEVDSKLYTSKAERDTCRRALAEAREKLTVQIYQLVRFMKDGKPAPMRKRDGNIYALIDLINEIGEKVKPNGTTEEKQEAGKDVARFFYLMRHHDSTFDFDLDLAEKQSDDNPVFYVQYAHARICSVLKKAEESLPPQAWGGAGEGLASTANSANASLATGDMHPREKTLLLKILELPNEIARCADDYAVNRLATYAIELARTYHHFYDACRVIQPDQPELTRQRIAYCQAARIALRTVLDLLGVSAPERMDREPVAE